MPARSAGGSGGRPSDRVAFAPPRPSSSRPAHGDRRSRPGCSVSTERPESQPRRRVGSRSAQRSEWHRRRPLARPRNRNVTCHSPAAPTNPGSRRGAAIVHGRGDDDGRTARSPRTGAPHSVDDQFRRTVRPSDDPRRTTPPRSRLDRTTSSTTSRPPPRTEPGRQPGSPVVATSKPSRRRAGPRSLERLGDLVGLELDRNSPSSERVPQRASAIVRAREPDRDRGRCTGPAGTSRRRREVRADVVDLLACPQPRSRSSPRRASRRARRGRRPRRTRRAHGRCRRPGPARGPAVRGQMVERHGLAGQLLGTASHDRRDHRAEPDAVGGRRDRGQRDPRVGDGSRRIGHG